MSTRRPNILLITSDQQHFSTLGVLNPKIKTPSLDRLCHEGTRFERAYCPNPVCTPSRSSLITGQYPSAHGAWTIGVKLPEDVPTVGAQLSEAGYKTSLIGKAHFQPLASQRGSESLECLPVIRDLDFWRTFHGPWYGFDHIELSRNHADESIVGQHYALWLEAQGLDNWADYFQALPGELDTPLSPKRVPGSSGYERERIWQLPEALHYTPWTAERTMAQIEEAVRDDQPFFTWASFHDPHPPYVVPEPWASMYDPDEMEPGRLTPGEHNRNPPHFAKTQQVAPYFGDWHEPYTAHGAHSHLHSETELKKDVALYYGMVSFMDHHIGRILDRLDALGIADNTLVVFTTDHGHFIGQHGLIAKGPFHYEDLIKLPFVVRWPDRVPEGESNQALQSLIDLAPTFLSAAGLEVPGIMQGLDQGPAWRGETNAVRQHLICENRHNPIRPHLRTLVTERYKLTVYREGTDGELFDLQDDPGEVNNLWRESTAQELKGRLLLEFMQATLEAEPTRMPRIAFA